jgi:hypothetical protein
VHTALYPQPLSALGSNRLDDCVAERCQVSWRAGGDEVAVDHDCLVHPGRARVCEIVFDRHESRTAHAVAHGAARLRVSCRAEHPWAVANGSHGLVHSEHAHDEREHRRAAAHVVWRKAARDYQRVELVGRDGRDRRVRDDRVAELACVDASALPQGDVEARPSNDQALPEATTWAHNAITASVEGGIIT